MFKLFTRTNPTTATIDQPAAEPQEVRQDFTISDYADMPLRELFATLRQRTVDFAEDERLAWAATDFNYGGVVLRVKLTEDWDVVYSVNGLHAFDLKDAIRMAREQVAF